MTGPLTTDAELLEGSRTAAEPFRELYERHAGRIHGFHWLGAATRTPPTT